MFSWLGLAIFWIVSGNDGVMIDEQRKCVKARKYPPEPISGSLEV
jgi:hypothetical protein